MRHEGHQETTAEEVSAAHALSTIVVERMLDTITVVALLMVTLPFIDAPGWARGPALFLGLGFLGLAVLLAALSAARERAMALVLSNEDIVKLLPMDVAIGALEPSYCDLARGEALSPARLDLLTPLHAERPPFAEPPSVQRFLYWCRPELACQIVEVSGGAWKRTSAPPTPAVPPEASKASVFTAVFPNVRPAVAAMTKPL